MPTSSQALILQVNDGYLPPIFGRRVWRPAQSYQFPVSNIHINQRLYQTREPVHRGRVRIGSAHDFRGDIFSALPELLRVQGLKGSILYERGSNAIHYDVETLPVPRYNGWTLGVKHETPSHGYSDKPHSSIAARLINANISNPVQTQLMRGRHQGRQHAFVKMSDTGEIVQLSQDKQESAEFFKLVKAIQSETLMANENNFFRLIKASPLDPGAFRVARTTSNEIGTFYLVPPEGFESNEFRLLPTEHPGCFTILRADPQTPGAFKRLEPGDIHGEEFKMVMAKTKTVDTVQRTNGPEHHTMNSSQYNYESAKYINAENRQHHQGTESQTVDNQDRYAYFNDIFEDAEMYDSARRKEFSLPDIMLNDPNKRLHNPLMVREEANDSYKFNAQEFAAQYLGGVQETSSEVYEKLVELGFRRAREDTEQSLTKMDSNGNMVSKVKDKESAGRRTDEETRRFLAEVVNNQGGGGGGGGVGRLPSCDWRTFNFDKWTRTTEAPFNQLSPQTMESTRMMQTNKTNITHGPTRASLIEELKMNPNYKQWKKKNLTGVRMRKELPPSDPRAVCLTMADNVVSHDTLLQQIQKVTGNQLASLQFDPVSVHSQTEEAKSRWILRFKDESTCENLIISGLCIMGVTYPVRKFNDVMKEEHEAYKFKLLLQKIQNHKDTKTPKSKPNKKLKTTQTQTTD